MLEKFLQYIQYEKKFSSHTVLSYKTDIKQFTQFLENEEIHAEIETVTADEIRLWLVYLMDKKKSEPTSVCRKLSSLKSFYRFLLKNKLVKKNPTVGVVAPKKKNRLPNYFSEKEMNAELLHKVTEKETEFETLRNDLIIELLYQTGMRRAELTALKDKNVDFYRKTIKVFGKRRKERIIPLGKNILDEILNYIEIRNKIIIPQDNNLFLLKNGKQMYDKAVYLVVEKRMGEVSTLEKHSPHILRHTFATTMLNNGAELNAVKELLGHSSLASTQIYTHATFAELQKIYRQAHPRAEKK
ncbi:MAG: tyrosine-type recombinase/integrase [Prevotellaceae bacterium]|jgi:integrase/recombinase XerC|nr:tyrosine-type recombinase/integrase [Prevotellaceae bacterium]